MPYRIAGIDVHKKMLAVVVSDVEIESEFQFEYDTIRNEVYSCVKCGIRLEIVVR